MEPNLPAPNPLLELGNYRRQEVPALPEAQANLPIEKKSEKTENSEITKAPPNNTPVLPLPRALAKSAVVPVSRPAGSPIADDDAPLVAADDELIEKEWVDKAKKIVAKTKDNPYQQEKEVSRLQADYLKKRYGKEVKLRSDES